MQTTESFRIVTSAVRNYQRAILTEQETNQVIEEVAAMDPNMILACRWAVAAAGPKGWMGRLRQRMAWWLLRTA